MDSRPRILFFGATNQLSLAAFESLLANGLAPAAVIVTAEAASSHGDEPLEQLFPAASMSQLPLLNRFHEPTLVQATWAAGIPLFALQKTGFEPCRDLLLRLGPAAACVVCFPWRLPLNLISIPPLGFLNVHPALLPQYRGPAPLFWLFQRHDLVHRGVTVHQMDAGLDTGPLVRQEPVSFESGLTQTAIERQCGQLGGRLLLEAVEQLSSGRQPRPQTGQGSYHPWPAPSDFRLELDWSALRSFNFMRATNGSAVPYQLSISGRDYFVTEALSVDPLGRQDVPLLLDGPVAHIQFDPGILTARLERV